MQGGSQNQTINSSAPSWQQGYQQYGLDQSLAQYQNGGQLVAPFAPQQETAINNITGLASNGDPSLNAASGYVTNTLNNGPTSNPYLDKMFTQAANATQPRIASEFAGAGRNVDQSQGLRSQELDNLATGIYGGAYNTGVQQQETAANLAPSVASGNLNEQGALYGAGSNVQNLAQQYIQAPQNSLNQFLSRVTGNLGTTQTLNPAFNAGAGALGGALTGSSLGSSIGGLFGGSGSNWGSLLGALGGGLVGG